MTETIAAQAPELEKLPGHMVRRLHQISQGLFHQELEDSNTTPVQYGVLATISRNPEIDQQSLAKWVALDTSTTAGVVDRLELKGFVVRSPSPNDRRVKLLTLTPEGQAHLESLTDGMQRSQERMLAPLSDKERGDFMRLLTKLVQANNEYSRAPSARGKQYKQG